MSNDALTEQLLEWIGDAPRSYTETIEAWRTSCPRLTIWEDALSAGLIERVPVGRLAEAQVRITSRGRARLRAARMHSPPAEASSRRNEKTGRQVGGRPDEL